MKQIFFLLLFMSLSLFAQNEDANSTIEVEEAQIKLEEERKNRIVDYLLDLENIEEKIAKEKVWMKSYASYMTSLDIRSKLENIKNRIKYLKKNGSTISELDELNALISKEKILASQIEKLKEKGTAPFSKLLTPPELKETSEITNPLEIFSGLSLINTQNAYLSDYISRKEELASLVILLRKEKSIYEDIKKIDKEKKYLDSLEKKTKTIKKI